VLAGLASLGLASLLGWSTLPLPSVAGLMLFTACYFALIARSDADWLRILLTFAFGLVHGLGFAGILVELALPSERLVPALLGFNLGVEIGQLGIVLLLWPLLVLGKRFATPPLQRWASELSSAALCGLGLYWLVERAFPL
jgi:ABC-type nickel/cobalt efflux system permease component RcnA